MHAAALRTLGLDALYTPFAVPPQSLKPVLRALTLAGVEGLNVTVPLKEAVLPLLDRVDLTARAIGAVNTIVIRGRRTMGYNTDGAGFARAVQDLGHRPGDGRAVLLGAGGSARAVAWELTRAWGADLTIANRRLARAQRLARRLSRAHPHARMRAVALRDVTLDGADLLVNATSVGMRAGDGCPIDPATLRRGMAVYDLVYHRETRLVRAARRRGCLAANGLSMLLYQGAASLQLWLRQAPPVDVMRRALERAIKAGG